MLISASPQILDFDRISNGVLRTFIFQIGLPASEYAATTIKQTQPWEEDAQLALAHWENAASNWAASTENVNTLLSFALLLDQQSAPYESLRAVLPEKLLNISAMGCLLMGRALLRNDRIEEAKAFFLQGIIIDPKSGGLRRELGLILRRQGLPGDAILHFEDALELREAFNPYNRIDPNSPILVTRPTPSVDIYYYRDLFHIVRHAPGMIGPSARAIGGELFGVRRNAAYAIARSVLRLPFVKRFAISIQASMVVQINPSATPIAPAPEPKFSLYSQLRGAVANGRRVLLQQLALSMFAHRIDGKTESLLEAVKVAREFDANPVSFN
jgi:tetratricopeptide (TPR) repeat protein